MGVGEVFDELDRAVVDESVGPRDSRRAAEEGESVVTT
jgi:hypothetical protein